MNNPSIKLIRKHLGRIPTAAVSLLAAGFVLWGLAAPTPTPTPCPSNRIQCQSWPCRTGHTDQDPECVERKTTVRKMFINLLNDASTDKELRKKLLCSENCFAQAHTEVRNRLPHSIPFGN